MAIDMKYLWFRELFKLCTYIASFFNNQVLQESLLHNLIFGDSSLFNNFTYAEVALTVIDWLMIIENGSKFEELD